ncbi:MAG TPA: dihydrolipoamide acetyltransferase family protein [Thermomicrobiales bacterium]|nr:dihydrolipoamide acetyltransferase family protein [Thermomicrobiales bacterium]
MKVAMPQLGESVTEGTIGRWLKQPGEAVEKYEPLVEVTTDKVNAEIPSPYAGVLEEITAQEGETVHVGAQIAVIAAAGDGATRGEAAGTASAPASTTAQVAAGSGAVATAAPPASAPAGAATTNGAGAGHATGGRRRFTPLVLHLAEQHDIPLEDLGRLDGSGLGGRVTKNDVLRYIEARPAGAPAAAPAPSPAPMEQPAAIPAPAPAVQSVVPLAPAASATQPAPGELVPLTPMRRAIAEHMVRSVATSPHAWTMVEVDVTGLVRYRAAQKEEFARREGFPLSYVPFFIEAVVGALKAFPALNASWAEQGIQLKREINIGVAVALEHQQGLVVPVIKHADERNIVGLARAVNDVVARARAGKLTVDDMQGGTFTVNNPGTFGSILSQPIINQPQAGILTMEAIVKRPVVVSDGDGDSIAIRSMMNVCLSFDHRVLDGLTAGQFLADLKRRLETFSGSAG